jgi:hypothetical protein
MINPVQLAARFWLPVLLLVLLAGYAGHWFWNAFHDQGYAPEQPIAFSHKRHAGDLRMDCNYCHFNAPRGKHAGVPPMQVCLGCHTQVATDKPEIQKLLAIAEKGSYVDPATGIVKEGGVVHWNRIHKLPDHVYFSHEWHVKGGVSCQDCHGPVQDMVKVRQHSDLTMAWCLDCHRKSNFVGGLRLSESEPKSFTVGTANNAAIVQRQDKDQAVVWAERHVKGAVHDSATSHSTPVAVQTKASVLDAVIKAHPEWNGLPRWRIADLPESHRRVYAELYKDVPEADRLPLSELPRSYMNAATQCSTCHQ